MFSRIFINRPKFALVISILILIVGGISIPQLPIESMPDITPPTIAVTTTFPGADAATVLESVAAPIEEQVNGVENMIYMDSKSDSEGQLNLTVSFDIGTDVDMAQVMTKNRVDVASPLLPEEVMRQGVKVDKRSTAMVEVVSLRSPNGTYDELFISNYIATRVKDQLTRVDGVGSVTVFGAKDFSMRIWLDPEQLKARGMTSEEVLGAVRMQNVSVAAGKIGAPPNEGNLPFQYNIITKGRLFTVEEFGEIVIKTGTDGDILYLRDVARVELGSLAYSWYAEHSGSPAIAVGIYQLPGSNALGVAQGVKAIMDELSENFPADLEYDVLYDATEYIEASIDEVVETLIVAILLVIFVVWIFLQDIRATLIPAITIPVSLIGTFAVLNGLGMSINNLTLFGLVLVIGIVVDDAILVVENTVRLMNDKGWDSRKAITVGMGEVTGPVIASTAVLLAVFIPTLMMPGLTGLLYRQFAITISIATIFSSINALTLSPALCRLLLKNSDPDKQKWIFFRKFDEFFAKSTANYKGLVAVLLRKSSLAMLVFGGLMVLTVVGVKSVPVGFLPDEDQGYFMVNASLPDGASLDRTRAVTNRINAILNETPGVAKFLTVGGYSMLDAVQSPNSAMCIVTMDNWSQRGDKELVIQNVMANLQPKLFTIQEALVFSFLPPPIMGLGNASGFSFELQDRGGAGIMQLQQAALDIVAEGNKGKVLTRLNQNLRASVPMLYIEIDRVKAQAYNVQLNQVFGSLSTFLGTSYVNDFNLFGRTWKVMAQADERYRSEPADIERIEVRNSQGVMIPLGTFAAVRDTVGPLFVGRFNMYPKASITGQGQPGVSSGEQIAEMERLAAKILPPSMGFEWSGVTFQQLKAGNLAPLIFGLAFLFVYLFLVAQYESWMIPLAVLFGVPVAIMGAMWFTKFRGLENNVYTQVGLVLLIGLVAKTAILIVEFAKVNRESGKGILESALMAGELRFRAILMTALSFILGVIPLVIATGAGAASRVSLGMAVFGGMLVGTIGMVLLTPVYYLVIQSIAEKFGGPPEALLELQKQQREGKIEPEENE
ncbi:MAG: multidrug efflux RND transporter permease subunit [Candidatus Krumholzibacteria bacterium]|nr:multidrug efflux RND transporter permease subunit [Candidatus Krumholzibacteria bacterium]